MAQGSQQMSAILDALPVGVWVARVPDGEVVSVNATFRDVMGMDPPPGARIGELAEAYRLFTPSGRPYPEDGLPFVRAIEAGDTVSVDDVVVHRPDGLRLSLRCWARPLFDDEGTARQVVIAFTDITRDKRVEGARAEVGDRMLRTARMEAVGQLAGGLALDFNNLLQTIRILTSTLRVGERDPRRRQDLEQVLEATAKAVQLTRALAAFSGPAGAEPEAFSVHDVVDSVVALVSRSFAGQVEIGAQLMAGRPRVRGDFAQLEQALMNLAIHARDAMPDGGTLTVRTSDLLLGEREAARHPPLRPGWHVVIEVTDTGVGFAPGTEDRVFEPYALGSDGGPGAALGLATAYGIVQRHQGTLDAVSNPGAGSTMRIVLPAEPAAPSPRVRAPALKTGSGLILVVDDEPLVRAATETALTALGYEVMTAEDGVEAVEIFRTHHARIDAVLLDLVMPRMGGRETYRALASVDPGVKVVLTTGIGDGAPIVRELGVDGYLVKPFGVEELSEALAELLTAG